MHDFLLLFISIGVPGKLLVACNTAQLIVPDVKPLRSNLKSWITKRAAD